MLGCNACVEPEVEKPRENPPEDFEEDAASWVSLCHLFTISRAIGSKWYDDTMAADETD